MKPSALTTGRGAGLFVLPVMALLVLALAEGGLHLRVQYVLEPAAGACAHPDLAARTAVMMAMLERAQALQLWQALRWLPIAGVLLALLSALWAGLSALRGATGHVWRMATAYVLLQAGALGLAAWTLLRQERAWASVKQLAPVVCALDSSDPSVPVAQTPQLAFDLFLGRSAALLHNPGQLAMVLAAVLLVGVVLGLWLWRGARR